MSVNLSYIIGHRNSSEERFTNLVAVVNFFNKHLPGIEIIVVEQDTRPSDLSLLKNTKHVFLFNNQQFNRAWGFNVGIKSAKHNIVAFGDNDIVVPPGALLESMEQCKRIGTASPYNKDKVIDMSPQGTKTFLDSCDIPTNPAGKIRTGCNYAGGIMLMTKAMFQRLGGWEERMRGWGGEDSFMYIKLCKLNIPMYEASAYPAIHLYHDRGKPALKNPHWKKNSTMCLNLKSVPPAQIEFMCQQRIKEIGNPGLYKTTKPVQPTNGKISKANSFLNLKDFNKVAQACGITPFLDGGTLLGAVRDQDFCDDDQDDVDLTTFHDEWTKVDRLTREAITMGFAVYHKWDHKEYAKIGLTTTSQISFVRNGGKIDLMFKKVKNDWLWWTVFKGNQVVYKKLPYKLVETLKPVIFYGEQFFAPGMTEEYLTYRYGNWNKKVHRSNYSCYTSDKSIVPRYEDI